MPAFDIKTANRARKTPETSRFRQLGSVMAAEENVGIVTSFPEQMNRSTGILEGSLLHLTVGETEAQRGQGARIRARIRTKFS